MLLSEKTFAPRANFIMQLNSLVGDRNDGGTIVILPILPILPIPNDTAVFGLTGEASAGLVLSDRLEALEAGPTTLGWAT